VRVCVCVCVCVCTVNRIIIFFVFLDNFYTSYLKTNKLFIFPFTFHIGKG